MNSGIRKLRGWMLILFSAGTVAAYTQTVEEVDDPNSREAISRNFIELRDSVNTTLGMLQQNSNDVAEPATQRQAKDIQDLTRYKVSLDKGIDEIVNGKSWTKDLRDKSQHIIADVRKEFRRILSDLKDEK
jgi:hypothetical protein